MAMANTEVILLADNQARLFKRSRWVRVLARQVPIIGIIEQYAPYKVSLIALGSFAVESRDSDSGREKLSLVSIWISIFLGFAIHQDEEKRKRRGRVRKSHFWKRTTRASSDAKLRNEQFD